MVLHGLNNAHCSKQSVNYQGGMVLPLPDKRTHLHFMQAFLFSSSLLAQPSQVNILSRMPIPQGLLLFSSPLFWWNCQLESSLTIWKLFSSPINVQTTNAISYKQQKDKYVWQLLNIITQLKLGGISPVKIVKKQKKKKGEKKKKLWADAADIPVITSISHPIYSPWQHVLTACTPFFSSLSAVDL